MLRWFLFWCGLAAVAAADRPNVLFLISDDMRVEPGCYGGRAKTPNLDRLAGEGGRFDRAYVQFPLCNPSRVSMLTGRYPTTTGVLGNRDRFRDEHPDWVTLPQCFRTQGYLSLASGKIFHGGIGDPPSWSDEAMAAVRVERRPAQTEWPLPGDRARSKAERSDRCIVLEGNGDGHPENRVADRAIAFLREHRDHRFFLVCGFVQPHSPPTAPKRFYDWYRTEDIVLPGDFAARPAVPDGFPEGAIRPRNADLFIGRDASEEEARRVIQAYLAAVSWTDWNIGRVLDELTRLGLEDDTIVVFWSDHGYQLGEKGKWSKAGSLFEMGTRVPFIVRVPGAAGNGRSCPRVVEAIDIYPTLAELCGLELPEGLEGRSLGPLVEDPSREWDHPAFSVWSEDGETLKGVAIRTEKWRYAEFSQPRKGRLLLDPADDPGERRNLADRPEHREAVDTLHRELEAFRSRRGLSE